MRFNASLCFRLTMGTAIFLPCPNSYAQAPPTGACCIPDGSCAETVEADCNAPGTTWLGLGTVCTPGGCSGPCFFPSVVGEGCELIISDGCGEGGDEQSCLALGGVFGGWGATCISARGACCLDVGCVDTHRGLCDDVGGQWHGGRGCDFVFGPPPLYLLHPSVPPCGGACCVLGSSCIDSDHPLAITVSSPLSKCLCESIFGGGFQGESTCCNDVGIECPQPTGACCLPFSISSHGCIDGMTKFQCAYDRGRFIGDGTACSESVCPRGPCPGIEPCCDVHRSPGCSDPECCSMVCAIDPACCFVSFFDPPEWSQMCVKTAGQVCGNGAPYCPVPQDFNGDFHVDLKDFAAFQNAFSPKSD